SRNLQKAQAVKLAAGVHGVGTGAKPSGVGNQIVQNMRDRQQMQSQVRFSVSMSMETSKNDNRRGETVFRQVKAVSFGYTCQETNTMDNVQHEIIQQAQSYHQKSFKNEGAVKFYMQHVTWYIVPTATSTKMERIALDLLTGEITAIEFLRRCHLNRSITAKQKDEKKADLRLTVSESVLFPTLDPNLLLSAAKSAARVSETSCRRDTAALTAQTSSSEAQGSFPPRSNSLKSGSSSGRRRSGYVTRQQTGPVVPPALLPPRFSREPLLALQKFRIFIPEGENRNMRFRLGVDVHDMYIADDWETGVELQAQKRPFQSTGFLGRGSTKVGVYGRLERREFAITQMLDKSYTPEQQLAILEEEFRVLHFAEFARKEFERYADEDEVNIAAFKFNVEDSFIGEFALDPDDELVNQPLPHKHFIATRLLPCSAADEPVKKFTGNDDCGPPPGPRDLLTATIHAFSHFCVVYTLHDVAVCDLQGSDYGSGLESYYAYIPHVGMHDESGTPVLFDPQMHTSQPEASYRIFWDKGPRTVKSFLQHHLRFCAENVVCSQMRIQEMEFEPALPQVDQGSKIPPLSPKTPPPDQRHHPHPKSASPVQRKRMRPMDVGSLLL
ncbi:unnamed protein product, partial [Mycena citricolor]